MATVPGQFRLFEQGADAALGQPPGPAPATAEITRIARTLPAGVRLGTSSWSYRGWAGLVYDRTRSESDLARLGLPAYAAHPLLKTVGLDRTYYAPLAEFAFAALGALVPDDFRFLVKAHLDLTTPTLRTPDRAPGGGPTNPRFLDAAYAADVVIGPCVRGLGRKAGPILFQFPPLPLARPSARAAAGSGELTAGAFIDRLAAFLSALPTGPLYAVEVRNTALLTGGYRDALAAARSRRYPRGVAHCYSVHPTVPGPAEQAAVLPPEHQPALVCRWMLRRDQTLDAAEKRYEPFDRIVDEDPGSREAIADLCARASARGLESFVIAGNTAEGSAPLTLGALAARIVASRR